MERKTMVRATMVERKNPPTVALDHHTCPHFEKGNHEGGEGNHEEGGGCGPIGPETGAAKGETT